jgi:2-dehydropantoate 2-reductase
MRVTIFGCGAIGSHVAARLIRAGSAEVAVVARGPHLHAMRERGLTFRGEHETFTVEVPVATDDAGTLPGQDIVYVGLKTSSLPAAAPAIGRLLGRDGTAVFLNNGIPWLWNHGLDADPATLPLLDPDGSLWREVRPDRSVWGVVYSPNEIVEPGVVEHRARSRFYFGTMDGSSPRGLEDAARLFNEAGIEGLVAPDIRLQIWRKLVLNAPGNPLAALTRLTAQSRAEVPGLQKVAADIIREVLAVAAAMGFDLTREIDADATVKPTPGFARGRPSMLQDVLANRPTEVESLLGQVEAFARQHGVATPTIDVVLPLMRGLDRSIVHGE